MVSSVSTESSANVLETTCVSIVRVNVTTDHICLYILVSVSSAPSILARCETKGCNQVV
jgi:hypothetical protein